MKLNYLKVIVAVTAAVLLTGLPVCAEHAPVASLVSGEIAGIDVNLGKLQLRNYTPEGMQKTTEYRINLNETRVTDLTDRKSLVIKDLRVGQFVTLEVIEDRAQEKKLFAQKIITGQDPAAYSKKSYGDAEAGTLSQAGKARADEGGSATNVNLVGQRGLTGPAGSAGAQGSTGPQGAPGVALRGERGEQGAAGPVGERGLTGPRGPAGDIARGPTGEVGSMGPRGAQGEVGKMGEQGDSLAGFAGPQGAAGIRGERGPVGDAGAKGPTTYGPSGPAGFTGAAGDQGIAGKEGPQGSTTAAIAGLAGPSGAPGAMGAKGATGGQGAPGQVGHWVSYKEFNFYSKETSLKNEDIKVIDEIAVYLRKNPSLQIGIDGTAIRSSDQDLNDLRVSAIRSALIKAGVSPSKISSGEIGDKDLRQNGRVAVLFNSAKFDGSMSKK